MKRVSIVAVLMGLLSIFAVPFASPASAEVGCHAEIEKAGIIRHQRPDGTLSLSAAGWQRCYGNVARQTVTIMLQKYVVNGGSEYWRTDAKNSESTTVAGNKNRVIVRRDCNPRARVSKWRVVATVTSVSTKGTKGGRSLIHEEVRWLRC